ncbi:MULTISPECIES: FAD-dependent monooxygenase [unclassified Streptomyces]|uniref:NAD(P)/FAD-dependent oxidoreductase n=1 Tax=unclassified Streptomyces TaxID=2593676 RepID=UPI0001C19D9E|nr:MULTISPECIES: FAD-dependent monooxygenase [unclassified Streptomyces]AEN14111.1 GDP dissociation inhibitor [Streptomyces sp. SirexAA-E]MYR70024.1 FAD-dependent oxidoreductase [Streptomyces sp. SID4939]MYS00111.1 FAD-dependent oxidoreductase [Streptomyces sp. SID4940]MYT67999.1 FAD-dependent oxidoreductase [Streptomyces sp. SID8357]MYT86842.1 FAD-dependent oxidoreductase [Streptomyces sp. SID8360]
MDTKTAAHATEIPEKAHYDVIILGTGLAGSVAGTIMARHGAKVLLIDATSHPRFAIGESMTPQLVEWIHILAERHRIPELKSLASVNASTRDIAPTFGTKAHFGFMKHEPGREPDPREATQLALPKIFLNNSHMFRQDSDAFMFYVAVKYGCTAKQNWRAADVDFDDDGVTVTGQDGEAFRGKYLIDASGFRSPLAEKFDLRDKPARFKHHSRSMFTHYVGIKPFDDVSGHPKELRPPADWHTGTMHHLIERGWFWIIAFDNHKKSRNPLCSVGLTMDERTYPKPKNLTPDEEFSQFLDRYPAVKRQFDGASRVREWVSTDRLQYSSKQTIGDRWCLMSHAAGFLDPLFSRGLSNTFEVVDALTSRLIEALGDGDFSAERFEYVERLEQGLLKYNDDIVNSSFISFSHFRLWNAVFRIWGSFISPGTMRLTRARLNHVKDGDERHFRDLEDTRFPGLWWPESEKFKTLLESTAETCEKYEAGALTGDEAADIVFQMIKDCDIVNPAFGWKNENQRFVSPSTLTMARFLYWASFQAPEEMNNVGKEFLMGILKAGAKVRKLL